MKQKNEIIAERLNPRKYMNIIYTYRVSTMVYFLAWIMEMLDDGSNANTSLQARSRARN